MMSNSSICVYFVKTLYIITWEIIFIDFGNQMFILKGIAKLFPNNAQTIGNNKHHEENNCICMFRLNYRLILIENVNCKSSTTIERFAQRK